jgi:ABC-type multidrug transport system permease subunit
MYWFVGLSSTASQFFIFYLIAYLLTINGVSLGLMLGSMVTDAKSVSAVTPAIMLPFFLFSGFFKNSANLPRWIGWIEYISPVKYGFSAFVQNEVSMASSSRVGELSFDTSMWFSIGILAVLAICFRFASLFFLWKLRSRLE